MHRSSLMFFALVCSCVGISSDAMAGEGHEHAEQVIDSRPIVTSLPIRMEQPRRVLVRSDGSLVISDWGSGRVVAFRDGVSTVLVDDLNEPSGLAEDPDGNLYVTIYAGGETEKGSIIRLVQAISAAGRKSWQSELVIDGLTGPTDLAVDMAGQVTVAEYTANLISQVRPDGTKLEIAKLKTPSAVVLDKEGRLFATSSKSGTIVSIPASGAPIVLCTGLDSPSDLALNEKDELIVVSYKSNSIVRINTAKKSFKRIATVPAGTIGIGYRKDGNFVLVNWQLQTATQITNRLLMDCPHCDGKIPVRLKPRSRSAF